MTTSSKSLALLDLDGMLADDRHRVHFALARDWGSYFSRMGLDGVWRQGREVYDNAWMLGWDLAYCTGRREDTQDMTQQWLHRNRFDAELPLRMRRMDDRRPLAQVKYEVVQFYARRYERVLLFDDDPDVIAAVGARYGRHCTWYIKPKPLVSRAVA
jgi:hypothetical protein